MSKRSVRIFAFALVFLALTAGAVQASRLVSHHSQASASLGSAEQTQPTATPEPQTQKIEFSGTLNAIAGDVYTIDGKTVIVNPQTRIDGSPIVGDMVKVEAALQPDGSLLAYEIEKTGSDLLETPELKPTETSEQDDDKDDSKTGVTSTPGAHFDDDQDDQGEQGDHEMNQQPTPQPGVTRTPGDHEDDDHEMKPSEPAPHSRHSGGEHGDKSNHSSEKQDD